MKTENKKYQQKSDKNHRAIEEEGGSTFPPSFFQGLSILIIEITLLFAKLCYVFFSSTITLWKKSFSVV